MISLTPLVSSRSCSRPPCLTCKGQAEAVGAQEVEAAQVVVGARVAGVVVVERAVVAEARSEAADVAEEAVQLAVPRAPPAEREEEQGQPPAAVRAAGPVAVAATSTIPPHLATGL